MLKILTTSCLLLALLSCNRPAFLVPDRKAELGEMHYSAPVGGVSGTVSPSFAEEFLETGSELLSLRVGTTVNDEIAVIQSIRFEYRDPRGRRRDYVVGTERGANIGREFTLAEGSELVGISGRGGWYIDAIQFHFSDGSSSPEYGRVGGDTTFSTLMTRRSDGSYRGEVRGLYGNAGERVEVLGLIFWPLE